MSTGHLALVAASAIVGGKTAFSFGRVGDGKQRSGKESRSIHDETSHRPGNKATGQCKAIAAKACPFKHRQPHAEPVLMFKPVQLSVDRRSSAPFIGFYVTVGSIPDLGGRNRMSASISRTDIGSLDAQVRKVPRGGRHQASPILICAARDAKADALSSEE